MKNIFAKVTAIGMALLLSGTIISPTVPALADVDISGEKDDMEVKTDVYKRQVYSLHKKYNEPYN